MAKKTTKAAVSQLVVFPYRETSDTPSSLLLALTSWQKHFQGTARLVVMGDRPRFTLPSDVTLVECTSWDANSHVNVCRQLRDLLDPSTDATFILAADDYVCLSDFTVSDIETAVMHPWPELDADSDNYYIADLTATVALMAELGITEPVNFCCHAPHLYDTQLFLSMLDTHGLCSRGLDFETLYYNINGATPVVYDSYRDNGYAFLVLPGDHFDSLFSRCETHRFLSFGGNLTDKAYYDMVADFINKQK